MIKTATAIKASKILNPGGIYITKLTSEQTIQNKL